MYFWGLTFGKTQLVMMFTREMDLSPVMLFIHNHSTLMMQIVNRDQIKRKICKKLLQRILKKKKY